MVKSRSSNLASTNDDNDNNSDDEAGEVRLGDSGSVLHGSSSNLTKAGSSTTKDKDNNPTVTKTKSSDHDQRLHLPGIGGGERHGMMTDHHVGNLLNVDDDTNMSTISIESDNGESNNNNNNHASKDIMWSFDTIDQNNDSNDDIEDIDIQQRRRRRSSSTMISNNNNDNNNSDEEELQTEHPGQGWIVDSTE